MSRRHSASGGAIRVGTSGWSYPNWRGPFYPREARAADWLACYARQFPTVELNTSFYRLPAPAMIERWSRLTPPGFLFAVKAWRAITHERRLVDCREPLAQLLARIAPLGGKAGPILFQLPPRFPADPALLGRFLAGLPPGHRYAFEFRDPSWWCEEVYALLAGSGAAFVCFDLAGLRPPRIATGPLAYLRLHGFERRYRDAYPEAVLLDWARWLAAEQAGGREVMAYLDNTMTADDAVRDARRLAELLGPTVSSGAGPVDYPGA
ncbi:MAG: DUF72 domain-containing protein [Geminicoccaceae bacterium]